MKFVFGVSHPKHVYMFRYLIEELEKRGKETMVLSVKKDVCLKVARQLGWKTKIIGVHKHGIFKKISYLPLLEFRTLRECIEFSPDVFIAQALPHFAHVSKVLKKKYILLEDTEMVPSLHRITIPFADFIITPSCFRKDFGKKQVRMNSYFELLYLHPNRYSPKRSVVCKELGVRKDDDYFILRFVGWEALHDIGKHGLSVSEIRRVVKLLEKYGKVFITSEKRLPKELETYRRYFHELHDAIAFASLYLGEGGTMATEAAVLGTPSILISPSIAEAGNFIELEKRYGLLFRFKSLKDAMPTLRDVLENLEWYKKEWKRRRKLMLKEKVDAVEWMLEFFEERLESF